MVRAELSRGPMIEGFDTDTVKRATIKGAGPRSDFAHPGCSDQAIGENFGFGPAFKSVNLQRPGPIRGGVSVGDSGHDRRRWCVHNGKAPVDQV